MIVPSPIEAGESAFALVGTDDAPAGGFAAPMLLAGRYPSADAATEIVVNERAARRTGSRSGCGHPLSGLVSFDSWEARPLGEATIVGIVRTPFDLVNDPSTESLVIAGPGFLDGDWKEFARPGTILRRPRPGPRSEMFRLRGLQAGAATTITIDGAELLPAQPRLVTTLPLAAQEVLPNATATRVEIKATLAADVTPGLYNLRIASGAGISSGMVVAVDKLPQLPLIDKEKIATLPVGAAWLDRWTTDPSHPFDGRTGQTITIDVEANRLGSKLRPVVHLYDARGRATGVGVAASLPGGRRSARNSPARRRPVPSRSTICNIRGQRRDIFEPRSASSNMSTLRFLLSSNGARKLSLELLGNVTDRRVELAMPLASRCWLRRGPILPLATGLRPRIVVSDGVELLESDVKDPLQQFPPRRLP